MCHGVPVEALGGHGGDDCGGLCDGCDACEVCVNPTMEGECPDWCEEKCMDCAVCHGYPVGGHEEHGNQDHCEKECAPHLK